MATLSVEDRGRTRWIRFEGELDQSDVLNIKPQFDEALESWDGDIVLDLGGVTFLSTLGIGLIVSTQEALDDDDRALRLANVPESIERTFRTMNLDEVFERV